MSFAKNSLIVVLAVLVLVAGGLAWIRQKEVEELRAAAVHAAEEQATLQKNALEAEQRNQALEKDLKALEKNLAGLRSRPAPAPEANAAIEALGAAAAGPAPSSGDLMRDAMAMVNNPEMQRAMASQRKGTLNSRYGSLFKSLHLSPAELSQFKDLLVEKQMVNLDVLLAAMKRGINPMQNSQEFRQLTQESQANLDGKIKTLLGDGFAQFQHYQQTQGQRTVVNQLEQNLSYTDAPLTLGQTEQLVDILSQTASARQLSTESNSRLGSLITDETIARAQGVLSAAQLQELREIQQQQQASVQAALAMLPNRGTRSSGAVTVPPFP